MHFPLHIYTWLTLRGVFRNKGSLLGSYCSTVHSVLCITKRKNNLYKVCLALISTVMAMKNATKNITPHVSVMTSSEVSFTLFFGNLAALSRSDRKHITVAMAQPIIMRRLRRKIIWRHLSRGRTLGHLHWLNWNWEQNTVCKLSLIHQETLDYIYIQI